jgi:hypothetical protein
MDMARTVPVTTRGRVHEHEHVAERDAGFTNRERAAGPARVTSSKAAARTSSTGSPVKAGWVWRLVLLRKGSCSYDQRPISRMGAVGNNIRIIGNCTGRFTKYSDGYIYF